jgi:3-oxoacyl-[acyl-carrier protein] reductase
MSPLTDSLAGKSAVVTGASRGIGRAIALELARAGAGPIVLHARAAREAAEGVAAEIRELGACCGPPEILDFSSSAPEALVDRVWAALQGIDIWINNAGADVLTGEAARWPLECKLELLWRVDVQATMILSRRVGALMQQRGGGVILNMGWDQAETGMAGESGEMFAAVKGAVMAFTRSLARSLAPQVRVNCLAPGWIKTAWGEQASRAWQERAIGEALLARWGTPDDVARAARFLVSPAASFITGQIVCVNGGRRSL